MDISTIIGMIAAFLTTVGLIPQAVKIVRTRETHAISLWMYIITTTGIGCWLTYGLLIENLIIIIANLVSFVLAITILWVKIYEDILKTP